MIRVGFGYDAHRLVAGRPLILGGVQIPYERGLQGHSDADVLLHAACDALLGAAEPLPAVRLAATGAAAGTRHLRIGRFAARRAYEAAVGHCFERIGVVHALSDQGSLT